MTPSTTPPDAVSEPDARERARPRVLLPWAIKVSLGLAVLGLGATHYLSRLTAVTQASSHEARLERGADPVTTGSIGGQARRVALDPCGAASDLRLR